jgi:hypothetical protein
VSREVLASWRCSGEATAKSIALSTCDDLATARLAPQLVLFPATLYDFFSLNF